jgi:uncharacterized protein
MATAYLADDCLKVRFALWEKVLGLVQDADFPLEAIREVVVAPDGYPVPHGVRAPGLAVPTRVKVGTWRGRGSKQLVSVRRSQPALQVRLENAGPTELVIGMDEAASLAAALHEALPAGR